MNEQISILHTNDLHSHLERWPKIQRYLLGQKNLLRREGQTVLTFDIGDALDCYHPLTEATMGRANVKHMNEIGYDAVAVGNNEILGLSHAAMDHLYDEANFSVLLGNVTDMKTGGAPAWADQYKLMTTDGGTKIAVLGLTAPFTLTLPLLGWQPEAASEALKRLLPLVQKQADIVILLSHLGLPTDRFLAEQFPNLDLIIGAHTHHLLPEGEWVNQTLLAAAGKYGEHVGTINLTIEDGAIKFATASTIATDELPALVEDHAKINYDMVLGRQELSQRKIAELPLDYTQGLHDEHRLVDLGLKALEMSTETNIAMLSTGLFMENLLAGSVNANDIHELLPHAVHPLRTTLAGRDLWRLYQEVKKNRLFMRAARIRGMGFRGEAWGEIVWDGLEELVDGTLLVRGETIDNDAMYQVGSLDHYMFIPYFPTIEIAGKNELLYDTVFREDFASYLSARFPAEGD